MLKVLICDRWSVGADHIAIWTEASVVLDGRVNPIQPDQAVAFCASNELGVWNQERVKPRFR